MRQFTTLPHKRALSARLRLSEPSSSHTTRHPDLRPGAPQRRHRNHPVRFADRIGHCGRGESEGPECRLCHGQHDPHPHLGSVAQAGLDPRQARKRSARKGISPNGSRKEANVMAQPHWQAAERRLQKTLGSSDWKQMQTTVARVTDAAAAAFFVECICIYIYCDQRGFVSWKR